MEEAAGAEVGVRPSRRPSVSWAGLALAAALSVALAEPARAAKPAPRPILMVPTGHSARVDLLVFSADSSLLATAAGREVLVWDVRTGKELHALRGHDEDVLALAFGPDGRRLASADSQGWVRVWDGVAGAQELVWRASTQAVRGLAFSPDGATLASAGQGVEASLWDAKSGRLLRPLKTDDGPDDFKGLVFIRNGRKLAGLGSWNWQDLERRKLKLAVWDAESGKALATEDYDWWADVGSFGVSPDDAFLAFLVGGHVVGQGEVASLENVRLRKGAEFPALKPDGIPKYFHSAPVFSWRPGFRFLFQRAESPCLTFVWDAESGKPVSTLAGGSDDVFQELALSPDGAVAAGAVGPQVRLWDAATGRKLHDLSPRPETFTWSFGPRGHSLGVVRGPQGTAQVLDLLASKPGVPLLTAGSTAAVAGAKALAFSSDGRSVAVAREVKLGDKAAERWLQWNDAATGRALRAVRTGEEAVDPFAFSPDGKSVFGFVKDEVLAWDVATGKPGAAHRPGSGPPAFAGEDGSIVGLIWKKPADFAFGFWDPATGAERRRIEVGALVFPNPFAPLVLSRDGAVLAVETKLRSSPGEEFGKDTAVAVWNAREGRLLSTIKPASDGLGRLALSADGGLLAYAGGAALEGKEAPAPGLWDTRTGKLLRSLEGCGVGEFSPDGKALAFDRRSGGGVVGFCDPSSGRRLADLFLMGETDWVLVTPDGRFDGTQEGMKRIYYVQDNKPIPLDSFFERSYTPNLFGRLLAGTLPALGASDVDLGKPVKLPPRVRIMSPASGASDHEDIRVTVRVEDQGGGIDEVRLFQNGKLLSEDRRDVKAAAKPGAAWEKTYGVGLLPGPNELRATAFNKDRTESDPDAIVVELKAAQAAADLHVLAVGLSSYKNAAYNLNYGRADAKSFLDRMRAGSKGLFRRVEARELYDEAATRDGIEGAFQAIAGAARPQDVFVFYYAGHGAMSEAEGSSSADFHLIPYDVTQIYDSPEALAAKGLSARRIKELAARVPAQKQALILDACEAGGAVETFAMRGAGEQKALFQLARSAGMAVLSATGSRQFAAEVKDLGHGLFTYALLKGLSGEADASGGADGKVTVRELDAYLNDKVPELTRRYRGLAQYPQSYGRGMDFPLSLP